MIADDVGHPVLDAIRPLVDAVGGTIIAPGEIGPVDVAIEWDGQVVGGVRVMSLDGALPRMVSLIELDLGAPLADLDRVQKQVALRLLDERGVFLLRKSIEDVADLMGVSRITIYNYLNAIRATAGR